MESHSNLRPGEYMLLSLEQDRSLTNDWEVARRVRSESGGAAERLVRLLGAVAPRSVDVEVARFALAGDDLDVAVDAARQKGHDIELTTAPLGLRMRR
jgi:hypothetical protein